MAQNTLKVLMLTDGSKPYAENAGGDILGTFNKAVLGQLLNVTDSFELQSGLLKNWKWDAEDNSYELDLRTDLKFHDGSQVKAEDLEFTLLKGFFSANKSFYEIYLGNIKGVENIVAGTKYRSGLVDGIKITSPFSVKIYLKAPNPSFLYALTRPYFSFTERSALNDDLLTWKKIPIGAGHFQVASEDLDKIILKRVGNQPNLSSFNQVAIYKRNVSGIDYDISYFPNPSTPSVFYSSDASAIYTLFFTNQNELSRIPEFREAIAFGINKESLIEGDKASKVATEFLTSSHWRSHSSQNIFDIKKAKILFSKIPVKLRNHVWRIPVFAFGDISPAGKIVTGRLKAQFAKFNFKVEFYPSGEKFLSKETAINSPMAYSGRVSNNVDPLLMFASFKSNSAYKYDNSQNDQKYDKIYEEAALAVSTEDRVRTLRTLSLYTISHNFMIPLFENLQVYYFNPGTISSFGIQSNSLVLDFDTLQMK